MDHIILKLVLLLVIIPHLSFLLYIVGTPHAQESMEAKKFVGDEAEYKYKNGLDLELTHPIDHEIVQNWDDMQTVREIIT